MTRPIEPSDTERAEWPDATRTYVEYLEGLDDELNRALGEIESLDAECDRRHAALTAERDAFHAEVERLRMSPIKMTKAEYLEVSSKALIDMRSHLDAIRADERAKVIAEAVAHGQPVTDWEGSVSAVSVDTIQSLHTPASRAIAQATP